VAALSYNIPSNPSNAHSIKPHRIDNLPDHIKRNTDLDPKYLKGANWNSKERAYLAQIYFSRESTKPGYKTHPIEFIKDPDTRKDNWYLLVYKETTRDPGYYTNAQEKLSIFGADRLGWWDRFNSHHPDFQGNKSKQCAGPSEEVILEGLHNIATLQGNHPLREETPPVILPAIKQSTSLGQEIPITIQPLVTTLSDEPIMFTRVNII
jgi:hypothetical protein